MNTYKYIKVIVATSAFLFVTACSMSSTKPDGADSVRSKLARLQSDPELSVRAPVAIKEAELAVQAAEKPQADKELARHLVFMADRKVDIATARAQGHFYEDQRDLLGEQRETARLDSRTREANIARNDAIFARADAQMSRTNELAAQQHSADLQNRITELKAKETKRGLVVTLGDLLFASGKSNLKSGTSNNLDKLAAFLNQYPDSTVVIEGHTDSMGSEDFNLGLSQRRADQVKAYLLSHGIASVRISTAGKGEALPVASNNSAAGRQQNRRVEVIISNTTTSVG